MKYSEIREECLAGNLKLYRSGLVDLTFGNVSVFDPLEGVFAIKPSGVPYDKLGMGDMVVVDLEGKVVDGKLRPSSDTPTHCRIYVAFGKKNVRSVVHTHSRSASAFAQAAVPIQCLGTTHADYFYGTIPVTRQLTQEEVEADYEWETGKVIEESFTHLDPLAMPAVLVRNHGPFTWGKNAATAVENAQALEIVAEMALKTLDLNPRSMAVPDYLLDKHFSRKHGAKAYYGQ